MLWRGLLTKDQAEKVDMLQSRSAEFRMVRHLAMRFQGLPKGDDPPKLETWLYHADHSRIYGMRRFVGTSRQDIDAVRNAIVGKSCNGQVEGQIDRL